VHDGGDLRVQVWDRSALGAAAGCDARKRVYGVFVKGQRPPAKIFREHRLGQGDHFVAAFPLGRSSSPKRISATLMAVTKKRPFSGFRDNHAITAGEGEGRIGSETTLVSRIVITNVT
jgi:hypothetical protein